MAAPVGNQYAAKDKLWRAAIVRALEKRSRGDQVVALDDLAEKLLQACDGLDMTAIKELGDRLDGKPKQILGGDEESPFKLVIGWKSEK